MTTTDEPSDFELLVKFMTAPVHQFGLAVATADHRDVLVEVRARAEAAAAAAGVRVVPLAVVDGDRSIIQQLRDVAEGADVVSVLELEHLLLGPLDQRIFSPLIEGLNWDRDRLHATLRVRVVLWLPRPAAIALADAARDLDDVVLTRLHFPGGPAAPQAAAMAMSYDHLWSMPTGDSDRLTGLLDALLADLAPDSIGWADAAMQRSTVALKQGDVEVARDLASRAMAVFDRAGQPRGRVQSRQQLARVALLEAALDEGERLLRDEALPIARAAGDQRALADVQEELADILRARGDLDGALQLVQDAIMTFERLGDDREVMVARGRVADILIRRGEWHLAAALLRSEVLPRAEKLGDSRERTIAKGKLAFILAEHGDLDGSLQIYREDVIPGLEFLGDVTSRAMSVAHVAAVLFRRGDRDEAERLLREEALPTFRRLGYVRQLCVELVNYAGMLLSRPSPDRVNEARACLREAAALSDRAGIGLPDHVRATIARLAQEPSPEDAIASP